MGTICFTVVVLATLGSLLEADAFLPCRTEEGPVVSSIQSNARPYGLPIAGLVHNASTDDRSCNMSTWYLPTVMQFQTANLSGTFPQTGGGMTGTVLKEQQLFLSSRVNPRVYFCFEGGTLHNTFIYNTQPDVAGPNAKIVFPDCTWKDSFSGAVVNPGDWVDLGEIEAETQLHVMLISNGAYGGQVVFSTNPELNDDKVDHLRAFAIDGSPYLVLGFEDIYGGGDRDYNDVVVLLDIGASNVEANKAYADGSFVPPMFTPPPAIVCPGWFNNTYASDNGTMHDPVMLTVCARHDVNGTNLAVEIVPSNSDGTHPTRTEAQMNYVFSVVVIEHDNPHENATKLSAQPGLQKGKPARWLYRAELDHDSVYDVIVYPLPCSNWPVGGYFSVVANGLG